MIKFVSLIFLSGLSLSAQAVTFQHFQNPNILGVTVGPRHCFLWFKTATLLSEYWFEGGCYGSGAPALQFKPNDQDNAVQTWNFPGGSIGWIIQRQSDGTISFQIEGKGPDDQTEKQIQGVL